MSNVEDFDINPPLEDDEVLEVRRNIAGLLAGSRYAVRVRSRNGFGVASDWSEAIEVEAPENESSEIPIIDAYTYGPIQTSRTGYWVRADDDSQSASVVFSYPSENYAQLYATVDAYDSENLEINGPANGQPRITLMSSAEYEEIPDTWSVIQLDGYVFQNYGSTIIRTGLKVGDVWVTRPPYILAVSTAFDTIADGGAPEELDSLTYDTVSISGPSTGAVADFVYGTVHIKPSIAGYYRVSVKVEWEDNAVGHRLIELYDDDTDTRYILDTRMAVTDGYNTFQSGELYRSFDGESGTMRVQVRQTSGGVLDCKLRHFAFDFISA